MFLFSPIHYMYHLQRHPLHFLLYAFKQRSNNIKNPKCTLRFPIIPSQAWLGMEVISQPPSPSSEAVRIPTFLFPAHNNNNNIPSLSSSFGAQQDSGDALDIW